MLDFFKGTVTPQDWAICGGIVAAAVAICAAFYFLWFNAQETKHAALLTELNEVSSQLREARQTERDIDALRAEKQEMQELVDQFEERLPEKREIPSLLRNFEDTGSQLGLRVQLSSLPPITDSNKETIPYRVIALGTFHQIVSFINLLERDQRYLKISDLDIKEEEAGISEATFTLSTYRFIQSEGGETT